MDYIDTIKNQNLNKMYLAPYFPNLAAAELFFKMLKNKDEEKYMNSDTNFYEIKGCSVLITTLP